MVGIKGRRANGMLGAGKGMAGGAGRQAWQARQVVWVCGGRQVGHRCVCVAWGRQVQGGRVGGVEGGK